jgi:hypothetical protein
MCGVILKFILTLVFYVYNQIDNNKSRHIYKIHILMVVRMH